jgi:hypothetical protein
LNQSDSYRDYYPRATNTDGISDYSGQPGRQTMASMTSGCKWTVGTAVSIWLGVAATAQARVVLLENPYNPGEQVAVEVKGCLPEAELAKLLLLLKQRQTADITPSTRVAMASQAHAVHSSLPLMVGIGF